MAAETLLFDNAELDSGKEFAARCTRVIGGAASPFDPGFAQLTV